MVIYHDIKYNTKKTVCLIVRPKWLKNLKAPELSLSVTILKVVNDYKYFGLYLTDNLRDDLEIQQQYRMLCSRTNSHVL